ncbi:MAG TPA: hypothetical protein VL096_16190 [Pirellulaceae bacterium]|nr:hypothetical protein [Pirellulaceae bacterium]
MRSMKFAIAGVVLLLFVTGCGTGGPATSPVSGKVVQGGKPVEGGSLTFAPADDAKPIADSSPVITQVNADGTFKLTQGAVAGKHRILYSPPNIDWQAPEWDGKGTPPQAPKSPYAGLVPKVPDVEIKSGPNDITIELVAGGTS